MKHNYNHVNTLHSSTQRSTIRKQVDIWNTTKLETDSSQDPRQMATPCILHQTNPIPPPPYPGCGGCVAGGVNLPRDRQEDPASEPWEPHLLSLSLDDDWKQKQNIVGTNDDWISVQTMTQFISSNKLKMEYCSFHWNKASVLVLLLLFCCTMCIFSPKNL